jgi:hypothetical protein
VRVDVAKLALNLSDHAGMSAANWLAMAHHAVSGRLPQQNAGAAPHDLTDRQSSQLGR